MIVLGIDTSAYANAIGVVDNGRVLADFTFEARSDSLQKIISNVDFALTGAGLTRNSVQGFGVGLGPGSWTGIRVGVTVGKMLAYATGKPVCGIPTLQALAHNAADTGEQVCAIISVGARDTVYAAFYHAGDISRRGEYYVGDVPGLSAMITEPTALAGPEAESYRRLIRQHVPGVSIQAREGVAGGATVARLAAIRLQHKDSDDTLALTPLYLKESTARAFSGRYSGSA